MDKLKSYGAFKTRYQSDPDLLLRDFNATNKHAFHYIFEHHYRAAVLYGRNILTAGPELVEDLVQDAFINLWNAPNDFSNLNQIKSFIYTSVKNACIDKIRQNKVADKYQDHAQHQQALAENDFVEPLVTAETTQLIAEAIEALPEQGKNVFKMSLSGLTNHEIAQMLNISVNTVKTHKQRALASLRIRLGDSILILILLYHDQLIK